MKNTFKDFINEAQGPKFKSLEKALKLLESAKFGDKRDSQVLSAIKSVKNEIDSRKANNETNL